MRSRLVVVTGTGTGIGKTHFTEALLLALIGRGVRAAGIKPVESGVDGMSLADGERLARASPFHVKPTLFALRTPVAPALAARNEGVSLDLGSIRSFVERAREGLDLLLLELPGALFSPLTDACLNADFAASLAPDALLLAAPDRLGVLHEVVATLRAASTVPVRVDGIVLLDPPVPDLSTGTNEHELARLASIPVWLTLPRGTPEELAPKVTRAAERLAR